MELGRLRPGVSSEKADFTSVGSEEADLSRIRTVIAEGQGYGSYRDDVDPDRTARQAVVLGLGYFALEPILEGPPDPGRALEWKDSAIELLLQGKTSRLVVMQNQTVTSASKAPSRATSCLRRPRRSGSRDRRPSWASSSPPPDSASCPAVRAWARPPWP